MELSAGDRITENPTAANIAAAIDATPHPDGWTITLDSGDGTFVEAFAQTGGGYRLVSVVQKRRFNATAAVDAPQLKAIFVKYLNGDVGWRAECQWKAEQPDRSVPVTARDNSEPPQ